MVAVRLKDVAEDVGVSVGAVGWVLNGTGTSTISVGAATAERIREAANRLGYRVNYAARQLRGGRSGIIGLVTHEAASEEDLHRIVGIEQAAAAEDHHVMVATMTSVGSLQEQATEIFTRFSLRGVDGVIVLHWELLDMDPKLFGQVPVAFVGPTALMQDRVGVQMDGTDAGRQAAAHLIERGKRRIGFVLERHAFAESRIQGGTEVLKEHGLEFNPDHVFRVSGSHYGNDDIAEAAVAQLVEGQKVDAIIVENDHWAARILTILRKKNVAVPEQVAIIGYNNLRFCHYMDPPLTSMEEREQDIASAALDAIQSLINKTEDEADHIHVITPTVVVREST